MLYRCTDQIRRLLRQIQRKYFLKANKDHFEYWYSHALPIATVVYSTGRDYAVWADITEYLYQHSNLVETGPYNIEIPASQKFSSRTFERFASHFLKYLEPYRHKFGVALEKFATETTPTMLIKMWPMKERQ